VAGPAYPSRVHAPRRQDKPDARRSARACLPRNGPTIHNRWTVQSGAGGRAVGSLPSEFADRSEPARILIEAALRSCESYLTAGLRRMQERGELDAGTAHGVLAPGLMAAYQGGCLLSQAARSSRPMAVALDLALDGIEARRARSNRASDATG
jgi:hypothetical protein